MKFFSLALLVLLSLSACRADRPSLKGNEQLSRDTSVAADTLFVGYTAYANEEFGFSLMYPETGSVTSEGANRIKFMLLGPDNEPATEITDGFIFTVYRNPSAIADNAQAYAEALVADIKQDPTGREKLSEPERREVAGMEAWRYRMRTVLGTVATVYAFVPEQGRAYKVTYSISGTGYENIVNTMLASLSFFSDEPERNDAPVYTSVDIALLDYPGSSGLYERESNGEKVACDRVVFIEREIEPTTSPLTVAMNLLFSLDQTEVEGWQNFIARTNETLSFERARVLLTTGVASIYLSGRLSGLAGVCDNPRARTQIIQTALQFPDIEEVHLYLNGERTDLQPDGRGN